MRNAAAFRLTIHACVYFCAAALIPPLMQDSCIGFFAVTALILIASLLAAHTENTLLRVLFALLPFAGLLLVPKTPAALIVASVICVYSAASMIAARFDIPAWRYLSEFKWIAALLALLFAVSLFIFYAYAHLTHPKDAAKSAFMVFLIAAIALGLLALRCARAGNIKSARWQAGNIGFLALPLALGIAAGIGLGSFMRNTDFKTPIESLASRIASCSTAERQPRPSTTPIPIDHLPIHMSTAAPMADDEWEYAPSSTSPQKRVDGDQARRIPLLLIAAIGAALAAVLAVLLIKKGRRKRAAELIDDDSIKEHERLENGSASRRSKKKKGFGNADKVRELYRRYIAFLRMNGISTGVSTTSLELSERSSEMLLDEEPDALLRALYLRARYNEEELSDEEVSLAERAFDRITARENRRGNDS